MKICHLKYSNQNKFKGFYNYTVIRYLARKVKNILIITGLGFLIRIIFFFSYISEDPKRAFYTIDSYTYEFPAINLIEKKKYINDCPREIPEDFPEKCVPSNEPEIYRPPIYPLFIAIHYILFGERREIVIFSQNIVDSLKIPVIYLISKNLGLVGIYSFVPSIIYAVSPSATVFTQTFMTETLQGFLLLMIVLILVSGNISVKKSSLAGFLSGILSLLHPLWFFFSIALPFLTLILSRKIKNFIFCGIAAFLVISPWIIRNYMIWKIPIFRPGAHVFFCEIRDKMYKGKWIKLERQQFDLEILNKASERFGWNTKFENDEQVQNYNFDLTKQTQIANICREEIIKKFWKYPIEIHIAGFIRLLPPFGIAQLYYMTTGNIKPSSQEMTRYIIPNILEGKIKETLEEIREKRLKLLPLKLWIFYTLGWLIRISTLILSFLSIIRPKMKPVILLFIFIYGTFIVTTFESAQPRRFYTVEPILSILSVVGLINFLGLIRRNQDQRNISHQKEEK